MFLAQYEGSETGKNAVDTFLNTSVGTLLQVVLAIAGFAFLLIGFAKAVRFASEGNLSKGLKAVAMTALVVPFLFAPGLIMTVIEFAGDIVEKLIGSAGDVVDQQ